MPRGGALEKAVDDTLVRAMFDSLDALSDAYIAAYTAEGERLTLTDIDEIVAQMNERVQAVWQTRTELEPRSIGLGFYEDLRSTVPRQRQKLVLVMTRMERDHELARRRRGAEAQAGGRFGEEQSDIPKKVSGVTIEDVDAFELKPNLFGVGINFNHLIKRLGDWRRWRRSKKA